MRRQECQNPQNIENNVRDGNFSIALIAFFSYESVVYTCGCTPFSLTLRWLSYGSLFT